MGNFERRKGKDKPEEGSYLNDEIHRRLSEVSEDFPGQDAARDKKDREEKDGRVDS